jgi:hypothetical protein
MLKNITIFKTHGGGIVHSVLKYVILPLLLALGPAVIINGATLRSDISNILIITCVVVLCVLAGALLLEILARVWVRIALTRDNVCTGRIIAPGGGLKRFSIDVSDVTRATLSRGPGMIFSLYRGENSLLVSWNSQMIGTENTLAFLRALKEANPIVSFDQYTQAFFDEGGFTDIEKSLFKATVPLLSAVLLIFYLPIIELLLYARYVRELDWMQQALQDMLYITLIPFLGVGIIIFIARVFERSSAGNQHKRDIGNLLFSVGIIFFVFIGGVDHTLQIKDFMGRPQVLYMQETKDVSVFWEGAQQAGISFSLLHQPDLSWRMYVSVERVFDVEKALWSPVTVVFTKNLNTLLRVENTQTRKTIYKKENKDTFTEFLSIIKG